MAMLISIIPKTIIARIMITPININPSLTSIIKAHIIAPNTIKGERINKRKNIFTPV